MKIVHKHGVGEIVEKKSRFIANVFPVRDEEDVTKYLEEIRKKHYDARHNCFAYVIGEKNEVMRCSDDGEPSGTAGRPMLEVILGEEIHDVLVVVTIYFGGTLLGTGGLVRAYSAAVKEGFSKSEIVERYTGKKLSIETDYNGIGKLQYLMNQYNIVELSTDYTDTVVVTALAPLDTLSRFENEVRDYSGGKTAVEVLEDVYYGEIQGETKVWTC